MAIHKEIKQGETAIIDIPLIKDNMPIELTTAVDVRAILCMGGAEVLKFSSNTDAEYQPLKLNTADPTKAHIVRLVFTEQITKDLEIGILQVVVKVEKPNTDPATAPDLAETVKEYSVGTISVKEGKAKHIVLTDA